MKLQLLVERFQLKFNVFGRDHIRILFYFCTSAQLRKRTIVYIMDLIWLPHESVWINNPFPINFNITQTERSKNRSNSCKSEAESYQFHCVGGRKNTCILECYKSRKYYQHSKESIFFIKSGIDMTYPDEWSRILPILSKTTRKLKEVQLVKLKCVN